MAITLTSRTPQPPNRSAKDAKKIPVLEMLKLNVQTRYDFNTKQALNEAFRQNCQTTDASYAKILEADHHAHLHRVGLMSGLAVGLHNFPEGLATFVGTLADPTAGIAIAVAIALHNIPEGVVVAMPVYYATKSRFKGFFWAFLSGVTEPIGAFFGWLILSNMGDLAYAIMFAVVAGMMVYISIRELIPTALRFDPEDKYVTASLFFGMAVMAASLLLFKL